METKNQELPSSETNFTLCVVRLFAHSKVIFKPTVLQHSAFEFLFAWKRCQCFVEWWMRVLLPTCRRLDTKGQNQPEFPFDAGPTSGQNMLITVCHRLGFSQDTSRLKNTTIPSTSTLSLHGDKWPDPTTAATIPTIFKLNKRPCARPPLCPLQDHTPLKKAFSKFEYKPSKFFKTLYPLQLHSEKRWEKITVSAH